METVTLFRPVGPKELALIRESGWHEFPPRLPEQLAEFNLNIVGSIEVIAELR